MPRAEFFNTERGRFKPQIENATLPTSLLLCFEDTEELSSLQGFLRLLTPLSKGR